MQAEGKNKAVDKFSQARADPHASIQYTANPSLKCHLNHKKWCPQVLPLLF